MKYYVNVIKLSSLFHRCAAYPAVYGQFEQNMSQHIPATLLPAASFNSLTNLTRKDGIGNIPIDFSK